MSTKTTVIRPNGNGSNETGMHEKTGELIDHIVDKVGEVLIEKDEREIVIDYEVRNEVSSIVKVTVVSLDGTGIIPTPIARLTGIEESISTEYGEDEITITYKIRE